MLPTLADVLDLPDLRQADPVLRAGAEGLDRPVRWVHVSEVTDIAGLLEGGELILTTGIALPRTGRDLARYVQALASVGVCGLAVELGRRYRHALPAGLVDAARDAGLPLIELRREARFVNVTQAVHTLILDARMRELTASDDRQRHRTVLTALALAPSVPADVDERAAALDVPLAGRALTGVAIRPLTDAPAPDLLRDLATRAADTAQALGVPALVAILDDHHVVALLSQDRPDRARPVLRRLADQAHEVAGQRSSPVAVACGAGVVGAARAAVTVREAVRISDAAATLPARDGWFRSADLGLRGLVHELRDNPDVRDFVERELGALLAHPDADALLEVLAAHCRHAGNKTAAAAALFVSRPSFYDRLRKVGRVLDADLADPDVLLGLHFALLARETLARPELAVRAGR